MEKIVALRKRIDACTACSLYQNGRSVESRFGDKAKIGDVDLLVVGEAPDRHTIDVGTCFPSDDELGALLDKWLKTLCPSNNFVITDTMKHYPMKPDGDWRTPTQEEINACSPFLGDQIAIYRPKVILGIGDVAYTAMTKRPMQEFRAAVSANHRYSYKGTPTFFYHHPGYILHIDKNLHSQDKLEALAALIRAQS